MEEQQTAVEWLVDYLKNIKELPFIRQNLNMNEQNILDDIIEQAKEMEKQQIIEARQDGHISTYAEYGETPKCYLDGGHEQYYNETFKSE
jgi:hypothetical protein